MRTPDQPAPDTIEIRGLELTVHVGVPDDERAQPQVVLADILLVPHKQFHQLDDQISATVDYAAAASLIQQVSTSHPRQLIETLASDIASHLLHHFPLSSTTVSIRKFILPNTQHVAVHCTRSTAPSPCGELKVQVKV